MRLALLAALLILMALAHPAAPAALQAPGAAAEAAAAVEAEEELLRGAGDGSQPHLLHLPRTEEFVVNNRGQRLHLRSTWPAAGSPPPAAFVLSLHGYGAHSSRPTHARLAADFCRAGVGYVTLDFHAHGHSEGSPRGLVSSPLHLVDDALAALGALFQGPTSSLTHRVARSAAGLPFFVMGHSMGGGAALLVANVLRHGREASTRSSAFAESEAFFEARVLPHFLGALLVCPVIDMRPPPAVRSLVLSPLAALCPHGAIPAWLFNENTQNHKVWASPRYRAYIRADGWPANADGLSFGGNIRFGMLSTILSLADAVQRTAPQANFPFVLLHDMQEGGDIVVPAASSAAFVAQAPAAVKSLVNVPGGLHDGESARGGGPQRGGLPA